MWILARIIFSPPGGADRGQPTHFLPRRNRFTFEVNVPSDWGDRELVWELTVNGVTRRAFATLKDDYLVDNMVIASETGSLGAGTSSPESRANVAPVVTLQGDTVNGEHVRSVRVGESLSFTTHLMDDGVPRARRSVDTIRAIAARQLRQPKRWCNGKWQCKFRGSRQLARSMACFCRGMFTVVPARQLSTPLSQSLGKILDQVPTRHGDCHGHHLILLKMA